MKRKDEIRDIYQSESHDFEKDFTPQVAREIIEQNQRDLQHSRMSALFFGAIGVLVAAALIFFIIRDQRSIHNAPPITLTEEVAFIPSHNLPAEEDWVIDYQRISNQMIGDDAAGEKPLSTKWIKKAAYHIIMGQQSLAIHEFDTALEHFLNAAEIYPEIRGLHRTIGMLYLQRKEYAKASEHLEKALKEGETFDIVNQLGTAYIHTEEYEKAEKNLLRAIVLQPEKPAGHLNIAKLYRKMEKNDDSVFHFDKYIALNPDDFGALQEYALYLVQLERWGDAEKRLTRLTGEISDVAPIYFLLAQVQIKTGKPADATVALQQGIELIDPNLALTWLKRDEFDSVRDSAAFKDIIDKLEIDAVSLRGAQ